MCRVQLVGSKIISERTVSFTREAQEIVKNLCQELVPHYVIDCRAVYEIYQAQAEFVVQFLTLNPKFVAEICARFRFSPLGDKGDNVHTLN